MDVSPVSLSQSLRATLTNINEVMLSVRREAERQGQDPSEMKYPDGKYVMADLLLSKSNCLLALSNLQSQQSQPVVRRPSPRSRG